jgi:hypothetical protein
MQTVKWCIRGGYGFPACPIGSVRGFLPRYSVLRQVFLGAFFVWRGGR